jgi:Spy/CpxP family protein refolding chaperone
VLHSFLKQSVPGLIFVLLFPVVSFGQQSPYAGQQSREIKALSSDEIQGYLSGSGMGFAKAAELNHYPGPKHVLELADALHLTERQRTQTLDLYESMRQDAVRLGKRLVEEERRLDHLFATQTITEDQLEEVTREIARYQGALRQVHLRAHLAQRRLLTAQQLQHYDTLRGYTSGTQHPHRHKHE